MTDQERKYLADIAFAIELIQEFTTTTSGFEEYDEDRKTQSAVERQLGIIGEAVNQFEKLSSSNSLKHAPQIVAFRNRIIHAYDSIDNSMVWVIIKKYLPLLLTEVKMKL